ncbi:MAG: S8 family serine peptidase [Timaviella obliquedivisa GSE-PSE-MK23-08B]|jgi:subtilisin family serine protease|nr:S8 family serine peptidase [Timaviella obliquedivisa GSE-PSE-MK23-08B]
MSRFKVGTLTVLNFKSLRARPLQGDLSPIDARNKQWHSFKDDYALTGLRDNQRVQINLQSHAFDAYLQLIDSRTGKLLAQNDDADPHSSDSRLTFNVREGTQYILRVTSYERDKTGRYKLQANVKAIAPNLRNFDANYGYGLINASAAVAHAAGQKLFANVPNSPSWNLNLINAPAVWAQGHTGQGIIVAVLDTGVNYNHPDLASNIWVNAREVANNGIDDDGNGFTDDTRGWSFVDTDTNDPMDFDGSDNIGHGTHVAGTIAALNNNFGTTGVAPNAKIMPIRVIGGGDDLLTERFDANLAAGIRYAVNNGARVLNISLGNDPGDAPLVQTRLALKYARQLGAIAVMASGNERLEGATSPIDPASYAVQGLGIAVGAVDRKRALADFSNPAGNRPLNFVVAPGVGIRSTTLEEKYTVFSGTSMATPHVAGIVALMLSANPSLTATQVEKILTTTTTGGLSYAV